MILRAISPALVAVVLALALVAAVTFAPTPAVADRPPVLTDFTAGDVACLANDGIGTSTNSTHDERETRYTVETQVVVPHTGYVIDDATLTRVAGTADEYVFAVTTTDAGPGATCVAGAAYTAEFTLPVAIGEPYKLTYTHDGAVVMVDEQFADGSTSTISR